MHSDTLRDASIAIAHKHYPQRGGAEHVAEELARTFDAPIYTALVADDVEIPSDVEVNTLIDGRLAEFWSGKSIPAEFSRDFLYQFIWDHVDALHDYDVVIVSGNGPSWYIPPDDQVVVKYVHSTPRTPYDRYPDKGGSWLVKAYGKATRVLTGPTVSYPDTHVANSELVRRRCERYWGLSRESTPVVYPPTDVSTFGPENGDDKDYYLTFSRLVDAKRIDAIVEAFDDLDARLVVGGEGPQRDALEAMAGDNVEFVGYMSEDEKRRRLAECRALVFNAANEDFGIVPVEAFASGTPVLGCADGYTQYHVRDGETGYTHPPTAEGIASSVRRFEEHGVAWSSERIQRYGDQFSLERFREQMREIVAETKKRVSIEGPSSVPPTAATDEQVSKVAVTDGGDVDE